MATTRAETSRHARRAKVTRRRRLRRTLSLTVGLLLAGTIVARAGEAPTGAAALTTGGATPTVSATGAAPAIPTASATVTASATSAPAASALAPKPSETTKAVSTASPAGIRIEAGTYIMWKKSANLVLLVKDGLVVRTMPTTDQDSKTPVGDYKIWYKQLTTAGYDAKGNRVTLKYFLPYHVGPNGGNIGFHQVPYYPDGTWLEPLADVGKPGLTSEGCERLRPDDALAVWDFAKKGTVVKVR